MVDVGEILRESLRGLRYEPRFRAEDRRVHERYESRQERLRDEIEHLEQRLERLREELDGMDQGL
jgi:hypothetical protein